MDWFDLLVVQGTCRSLFQHHGSKAPILQHSAFFIVQLSHPYMTTGKIANICWIIEKSKRVPENIYFCLTDYTKAFDSVHHNKLWKILKEMGMPDLLACLLRNLYMGQKSTVRTRHGTMGWFKNEKGILQACILLPRLHVEYSKKNASLDDSQARIQITGSILFTHLLCEEN